MWVTSPLSWRGTLNESCIALGTGRYFINDDCTLSQVKSSRKPPETAFPSHSLPQHHRKWGFWFVFSFSSHFGSSEGLTWENCALGSFSWARWDGGKETGMCMKPQHPMQKIGLAWGGSSQIQVCVSHKSQTEESDPKVRYAPFGNIDTYTTPTKWMFSMEIKHIMVYC